MVKGEAIATKQEVWGEMRVGSRFKRGSRGKLCKIILIIVIPLF